MIAYGVRRRWLLRLGILVLGMLSGVNGGSVYGASAEALGERLEPVLAAHRGKVAVAIKHLDNGAEYRYKADEAMPTASLIKLAVLVTAYRLADAGTLDLHRAVVLKPEDKVPGSGVLSSHFSPGAQFSVLDAIRLMIAFSDNTATNLVLDQIGLPTTAQTMEQLGFANTKIHAKVYRGDTSIFPERSKQFGLGSTTPAEMVRLLEQIHRHQVASDAACEAMMGHLFACEDKDLLMRDLPPGTKCAHKTGAVTAVRTDAGIIFAPSGPIAVCVMTDDNQDKRWVRDNAAEVLCGKIGRIAYDHFNPPGIAATPQQQATVGLGAEGPLVEALQRTLNARLSPSPELGADGDFGPVTRDAVLRFQREQKLPVTGEVDVATWTALGTLVTEDAPLPDPATVNAQVLPREPPDDPQAAPLVTCRAWAIADARTGQVLWGKNERAKLDIASTTKIMTAYLVLRLAEQDPRVLEEEVIFSARAADTTGSAAGLRAGEKVTVRELLYGLLLPSGNDAATAFAEHFGPRLAQSEADTRALDAYACFIAAMNRTATELGMRDTLYRNPHGMTEEGHVSTAADLALLTHAAEKLPLFHDYTSTRQHGCTISGPGGYQRNVVWKNTNHLLGIEGYDGVKTGTTGAAGACLVSTGQRGDRSLIVVVLGGATSDSRYVDTRNLFRWAWSQTP
jgi:D-alanyl-D-alanine carboxypeptidase (penicillin-binding protein 5/6)